MSFRKLMITSPDTGPFAVGAKTTLTLHVALPASQIGQVEDVMNGAFGF